MNRNIIALLEILRENVQNYSGMCSTIKILEKNSIITLDEANILHEYLINHKPEMFYSSMKNKYLHFSETDIGSEKYWFPIYEPGPRIKWINQQLEFLMNESNVKNN